MVSDFLLYASCVQIGSDQNSDSNAGSSVATAIGAGLGSLALLTFGIIIYLVVFRSVGCRLDCWDRFVIETH